MASVKIICPDRIYKDGKRAVMIRAIVNRKSKARTLFHIQPDTWDSRNNEVKYKHPDSERLNAEIGSVLQNAKEYIKSCRVQGQDPEIEKILNPGQYHFDIISRLQARADTAKNFRTRAKWEATIQHVTSAGLNQPITGVTDDWAVRFDAYLIQIGNNPNTRRKHHAVIGSIFKEAALKGEINSNPFQAINVPAVKSKKAKLRPEEFEKIRTVELPEELEMSRTVFVFSVLARGIRSFDAFTLTWSNIVNGRLVYTADKSAFGKPRKTHDIRLTCKLLNILSKITQDSEYIFPYVTLPKSLYYTDEEKYKRHVESIQAVHNRNLKKIAALAGVSKNVSMHVSRHTFAFMAGLKGIDVVTIRDLLGHSSTKTTIDYMDDLMSSEELDDAADRVFGGG